MQKSQIYHFDQNFEGFFTNNVEGLLAIPNGLAIPNTPPFIIGTDNMAFLSSVVRWHASFA